MKKVGKLFLGLFLGLTFLVTGCSDGSSSNNAALLAMMGSSSGSSSSGNLSADGNSADEGYVGSFAQPILNSVTLANSLDSANEKVILFYYRADKAYSNWGLWLWPDGGDGSPGYDDTNGKFQTDSSTGLGYMILDSNLLTTATAQLAAINANQNLNFIIRDANWNKDPGSDQVMPISEGYKHFLVISGDSNVYKISSNMSPTISSATLETTSALKVVLGVKYGLKKTADPNGFTFVANDGTSIAVADCVNYNYQSDRSKNYTDTIYMSLSSTVDTSKTWTLKHDKFGQIAVSTNGIIGQALKDIKYTGDDLGLTLSGTSGTFKVWAPLASDVKLLIYADASKVGTFKAATVAAKASGSTTEEELKGTPAVDPVQMTKDEATGVWSVTVSNATSYKYYKYQIVNIGTTYYVCDIYAKAASPDSIAAQITDINSDTDAIYTGTNDTTWGTKVGYYNPFGSTGSVTKKYSDSVIYEMHVRDWSRAVVSDSTGKFLDIANYAEIINHLKDLGVTHVQILPMFDYSSVNANTNYNWGYNPYHYNVPEGRYVTSGYTDGTQAVKELRTMISKLHDAGIAVNMDVVYNHTSGTGGGSLYDSTVPYYYYRINTDGSYSNGSGCGNETNSEATMFKKYMIDSLKHWMLDYHINGFRFDLMGLHSTSTMKEIYEALKEIDSNVMVYGEPWTGGTSLVSSGCSKDKIDSCGGVGCFNDTIRNAIKGAEFGGFQIGEVQGKFDDEDKLKIALLGTGFTDNYERSLNYIECHDNYTLYDKLIYSLQGDSVIGKDAIVDKFIRNPTTEQLATVKAEDKLAAAFAILAQGTPFINGGQEFCRTKLGNPDSYAADTKGGQKWEEGTGDYGIDTCNTINLDFKTTYADVYNVYKGLIALRKSSTAFTAATDKTYHSFVSGTKGTLTYDISNGTDKFTVLFNCTDAAADIPSDRTTGYTTVIDITTGSIVTSNTIPTTIAAKSFIILKN